MKTRISIPDKLFAAAEAASQRLGMSRSEFYAIAVQAFVDAHPHSPAPELTATQRLNEVYARQKSSLDPLLARMQSTSIDSAAW